MASFVLLGWSVGFLGAMVGAGGGFLLMPVLLMIYGLPPGRAAATSLVMVAASAMAGTFAYARQRQIDFRAGVLLALFAIPGSLAGARLAARFPAADFAVAFGVLLAVVGLWLALGVRRGAGAGGCGRRRLAPVSAGMTLVGGLAALFGIGGGPLTVPLLTFAGGMEVHTAAATSQFVILLSSLAGLAGYIASGSVAWVPAVGLSVGALLGSPLGAAVSARVPARRLLQILGVCLVMVGGRMVVK